MVGLILVVAAFVLAILQAFRPLMPMPMVPHLGWLAIALYFLSLLLGKV